MLHEQITSYVAERMGAMAERFFPDWRVPGFFAGYRSSHDNIADLLYVLAGLHKLGVADVAGTPVTDAMVRLLRQVNGEQAQTFWSYRIAESLLAFGGFEGNPLLTALSPAQRADIRYACDSTHIFDPETGNLRGFANNYWGVLARCEFSRQQLGILDDATILNRSLERCREIVFGNELGFVDDSPLHDRRYDIYSADTYLFLEPLWPLFDQEKLRRNFTSHVRLVEQGVMENGAAIVWGRSTGALSVCLTMEMNAAALHLGIASDAQRSLALVRHAFDRFRADWVADDLIAAHRGKHTFRYRAQHRLLQMTADCLGKLAYTALKLKRCESRSPLREAPLSTDQLFPPVDEFVPFDHHGTGVWLFRNDYLAFQLPIVSYPIADYTPSPRSPGVLDNPVDSDLFTLVPRVAIGDDAYTLSGPATSIEKTPVGLTFTYDGLIRYLDRHAPAVKLPCRCSVSYRVAGDTLHGSIAMAFETTPDAVTFDVAEGLTPLAFTIDAGRHSVVEVDDSPPFRSFWGEIRRWHQTDLPPAREMRFGFTLRVTSPARSAGR